MSVQGEIDAAVARGNDQHRLEVEQEVNLSKGQTPTIDSNVYEPAELKDRGYPLANPTNLPNNGTKENARFYAGRDASDGTTLTPTTAMADVAAMSPQSGVFHTRSQDIFSGLESAQSDVDVEMGLTNMYKQFIDYTNTLSDSLDMPAALGEANRIKWNMIDRLEKTGFDHLQTSERNDDGLDDAGMNGLQMLFAAGIFQGKPYEEILKDVGDTGANPAQLEETYDRAMQGNERAQYNTMHELPSTNEQAAEDPRYIGSVMQLMKLNPMFKDTDFSQMSSEDIMKQGKWYADTIKSNLSILPDYVKLIKDNPDSPVAEAIDFLLQTDDNLPFEMADAGRFAVGMMTDPTTYMGGAGIWAKFAKKGITGKVLSKLGVNATQGAAMGATYSSLYDIGMQHVDIAARNQPDFDMGRLGGMAALGAGLGYAAGGIPAVAEFAGKKIGKIKTQAEKVVDDFKDAGMFDDEVAGLTKGLPKETKAEARQNVADEIAAVAEETSQKEPWIGVMDKDGNYEFKNRAEGEAADWHHSFAMTKMKKEFDDDASLRFVRMGDAKEIEIKGEAALDPMGKGKQQIKKLAIKMKEEGVPGSYKIKVEDMGLDTDWEGETLGTIDKWIKMR